MSVYHILYNPSSSCGNGKEKSEGLNAYNLGYELTFKDITTLDYDSFFASLGEGDGIIICGGDGTLNRFINDTEKYGFDGDILYYGCGTGNDFLRDIGSLPPSPPVRINEYLKNLPTVTVNGKSRKFLNNVGFGIDGYCTEVGDAMRESGKTNINYAGIAVKGLLGGFRPVSATVTVDGVSESYKHVWLAPTMKGRFYGGGMMPTPGQDRLAPDGKVSVMVFKGLGKIKTLMLFPSIFEGEHIKHKRAVTVREGSRITVSFNRPCPLQIDGETVHGVTEYTVVAGIAAGQETKEYSETASK